MTIFLCICLIGICKVLKLKEKANKKYEMTRRVLTRSLLTIIFHCPFDQPYSYFTSLVYRLTIETVRRPAIINGIDSPIWDIPISLNICYDTQRKRPNRVCQSSLYLLYSCLPRRSNKVSFEILANARCSPYVSI